MEYYLQIRIELIYQDDGILGYVNPPPPGAALLYLCLSLFLSVSVFVSVYVCLSLSLSMSCLLYTSPSPRDMYKSRMPSSA